MQQRDRNDRPSCRRFRAAGALAAVAWAIASLGNPQAASAQQLRTLQTDDGVRLQYVLLTPDGFDPQRTYPVVVGMPPGAENEEMLRWTLNAYWGRDATARGWVVVSPVAPAGGWRNPAGARAMVALLDAVAKQVHAEGGKVHLAGCSNGGNSAFYLALAMPERFHSLTTLPGSVGGEGLRRLQKLRGLKVRLNVGQLDTGWGQVAREIEQRLRQLGIDVERTEWPGEGHVIRALAGGELMRRLDALRER